MYNVHSLPMRRILVFLCVCVCMCMDVWVQHVGANHITFVLYYLRVLPSYIIISFNEKDFN